MSQITDQIKDRIDLVELVREYVPQLKKAGVNWKSRCPFHQEKTASFVVSSEKQIWHCFGCSKGGDVFGFVREIEGVEFSDALRLLAKRAGIRLERQDPQKASERSRILDILRIAAQWYHQALLKSKSGQIARDYLLERKISDKSISEWQLGFAPDTWEGVSRYLKSRGYNDEEISRAGLSSRSERGSFYDRFRGRVMFPISDVHGTVVGFTARKLSKDDTTGKYINTPETPVYHKSEILYGLSRAKQEIRKDNLVVVVEGNMDCISSHQAGVVNVVASSGTALTKEQINLLKRFTKNVALAFDPDSAGQEALARAMEAAWQEDMSVKIITLPENCDPDNLIKKDPNEWKKRISHSQEFMDWIFESSRSRNDVFSAQGKKLCAKEILPWIARLPDLIEQTHYLQLLGRLISVDEQILRSAISKSRSFGRKFSSSSAPDEPKRAGKSVVDGIIIRLLALMILDKSDFDIPVAYFSDSRLIELYKRRKELYDGHIDVFSDDIQPFAREAIVISEEIKQDTQRETREKEVADLARRLKECYVRKEINRIKDNVKIAEEAGDENLTLKQMSEWSRLKGL